MDLLTKEQRHKNMAAIKGKDTKPEMVARRICSPVGFAIESTTSGYRDIPTWCLESIPHGLAPHQSVGMSAPRRGATGEDACQPRLHAKPYLSAGPCGQMI